MVTCSDTFAVTGMRPSGQPDASPLKGRLGSALTAEPVARPIRVPHFPLKGEDHSSAEPSGRGGTKLDSGGADRGRSVRATTANSPNVPFVGRAGTRREGADRRYSLVVPFFDAIRGTGQRLSLADGGILEVSLPLGIETGQILRLRGKGGPGEPPGDALIEVEVGSHPLFRREERDVHLDLPVSLSRRCWAVPSRFRPSVVR